MFVTAPCLTFRWAVRFRLWSAPLQRLPKIGRHLWTTGVLRCIRAHNTVFKKCMNYHAFNRSQLQIHTLALNHIKRFGMPTGIPSLTGWLFETRAHFLTLCVKKYEFWPRNKFWEHDTFVSRRLPAQITCECGGFLTLDETLQWPTKSLRLWYTPKIYIAARWQHC